MALLPTSLANLVKDATNDAAEVNAEAMEAQVQAADGGVELGDQVGKIELDAGDDGESEVDDGGGDGQADLDQELDLGSDGGADLCRIFS